MKIFELDSLSAGYGGRPVLKGITLALEHGQFAAVIGPNGSGKSTLLRVLTRQIPPMEGTLRFRGTPAGTITAPAFAREVAAVPQFMENILPFTVLDFLKFGRFPHQKFWEPGNAADRKAVERALDLTGLSPLREKRLTELSGGERQLVFIARALVQSSGVILLDEPVSHLDIRHSIGIMDILHNLNRSGTTVIMVLHDINLAADYATRVIGLREGGVFMDGPPREVITYQRIEALFDTQCLVYENPITKRPYTFTVPGHILKERK